MEAAKVFFQYLRILQEVKQKIPKHKCTLWRGVGCALPMYNTMVGKRVTWYTVSSTTPAMSVAQGFLGSSGPRTMFRIKAEQALSIRDYSAFKGEEEFLLFPGTVLLVKSVKTKGGLSVVTL